MRPKLYLVDVSSMFFRAFYAIPPLTNSKKFPTNALYGFLTMSLKLLKEMKADHVAYCFDREEPSFRKDLDPRYKAHRSEVPEDLLPQIPYVRKLTDAMGIPAYDMKGFEADDIIGTLTKLGRDHDFDVIIVSGDKDFSQLVSPHVQMMDTMKDKVFDPTAVKEKYGVAPEQFIDYLALVGDSSDNIPGVRGVGPKGAQKLLEQFSSIEDIYARIEEVKNPGLKKKLEESREDAFLSKKLVTIALDVPLNVSIDDLLVRGFHETELRALIHELEFKTMERQIFNSSANHSSNRTASDVKEKSEHKAKEEAVANTAQEEDMDLITAHEFQGLLEDGMQVWVLLVEDTLSFNVKSKVYQIAGDGFALGEFFHKKNIVLKGFDLKEIYHRLDFAQAPSENLIGADLMLMAYALRSENMTDVSSAMEKFLPHEDWQEHTPVAQKFHLMKELEKVLKHELAEKNLQQVLHDIDYPILGILYEMEKHGVLIDRKVLDTQNVGLKRDLDELEKEIYRLAGEEFNIASPRQLGMVLFEKLKLPVGKKTKTGFSTDTEVLEKLSEQHPICAKILEYRELAKLKSTYVEALPKLVDQNGRIHTHLNQALTATGRLSSTNPNLQNIPIRTPRGSAIRRAFVAPANHVLVSADYSQIELRILAHITEDPGLVRAFREDLDIHTATASEVFNVSLGEVTPDLRRMAKAINFGIAYGQGAFGLSENLGISRSEASDIIEKYFAKFRRVKDYMSNTISEAHSKGYVESIFGRRRYLPELQSKNPNLKKFGERAAINAPIQGAASDIVKLAMIQLKKTIRESMVLQVHDELLFEVSENNKESIMVDIKKTMEGAYKLHIPLKVNIAAAPNWEDAH